MQNKAANTEDEEEGKEKRKGIVTRVKHILTIKSVERPKSEVRHPEVVRESGGPKENVNDDEGYLNQDSLLMDGSLDKSRLYDILSQEKSRRGANQGDEPIRESGNEPNRGDNEADKVKMRRPKVSKAAQVNEDGSLEDEGRPSSTFFQRGSMLVSSVRSSIRKMTASGKRKSTISDGGEEASGSPFDSAALKPPGTRSSCNESQDSGLGEDSDFDPNSSSLSARTPTPAGVILTSGSSRPSSSSLRKVSGGSSAHDSDHSLKKHVIIREPSLSALPSTNRKRRQYQNECCLETAKIYSRPTRIPEANATRKSVAERGGSVSSQWDHLFQLARAEVSRTVAGCDNFTLRLIFDSDRAAVRSDVADMDSVPELARMIHTVYKVLFFPWIKRGQRSHLSMILHCVQNFLVIMVEMAANLDEDDRLRYSRFTRDLLAACESNRYSPLEACLIRTRTLYIDLWCSLLCLPFKEVASPTVSLVERTLMMKRKHSVICEEDEGAEGAAEAEREERVVVQV